MRGPDSPLRGHSAVLKRDHTVEVDSEHVGTWKTTGWGFQFDCACGTKHQNLQKQYLRWSILYHVVIEHAEVSQ